MKLQIHLERHRHCEWECQVVTPAGTLGPVGASSAREAIDEALDLYARDLYDMSYEFERPAPRVHVQTLPEVMQEAAREIEAISQGVDP